MSRLFEGKSPPPVRKFACSRTLYMFRILCAIVPGAPVESSRAKIARDTLSGNRETGPLSMWKPRLLASIH